MYKVIHIPVGPVDYPTNCYIIFDEEKNAVIIDPGYDKDKIISKIAIHNLNVKYIFLTHCHADHLSVLDDILDYTKCDILIHKKDLSGIFNEKSYSDLLNVKIPKVEKDKLIGLKDKDIVKVGNMEFEIIHTPGHTDGSICIYEKTTHSLFTGDTLFHDCYGRVDLISGNFKDIENSLNMLFYRFYDTIIYPGHDKIININDCKKRIKLLLKVRRI